MEDNKTNKGENTQCVTKVESRLYRNKSPKTHVVPLHGSDRAKKSIDPTWEATFNAITDLVSIHDKDFRILKINKAFAETFKIEPEEAIGRKCCEIVHGTEEPPADCPHKMVIDTGKPHRKEFFNSHLGLYLEISTSPIFTDNGTLTGSFHVAKDITKLRKIEKALIENENKFHSMFKNMLNGFVLGKIILDKKGKPIDFVHITVNDAYERLVGIKKEDVIGKKMTELRPDIKQSCPGWIELHAKVALTGQSNKFTFFCGENNKCFTISIFCPKQGYFISVFDNITESVQNKELLRTERNKLRSMAVKLEMSEEAERARIAAGLHDEIVQSLAFLKIKMNQAKETTGDQEVAHHLTDMSDILTDNYSKLRHFIFDLSNPILDKSGLGPAVRDLLKKVTNEHNIRTTVNDDDKLDDFLTNKQKTFLYKAVKELIINIIKYAEAKNINVSIENINDYIIISVTDDGVGFNTSDEEKVRFDRNHGFGLFSIRERSKCFGGSLKIESKIGKGTTVSITMPVTKEYM